MATNSFERFVILTDSLKLCYPEATFEVSKSAQRGGFRFWSIDLADGFSVEVSWKNGRGFGVVAGTEFSFGEGVHEVYDDAQAVFDRVDTLLNGRIPTTGNFPVTIAELRKACGSQQQELAGKLGMTKGSLAQIEAKASSGRVQVDTLQRIVEALGAKLVVSATFPDGTERRVTVGR